MCLEFWHSQNSAYFHAQLWTAAVTHQALGEFFLKCLRKDSALKAHLGLHGISL